MFLDGAQVPAAAMAHKRGQEKLPHVRGQGQWPRGATLRPRSGAESEGARLRQRKNSREELPHAGGQELRPRGATPRPRSSGCAGSGEPRGASYSTFKVRKGGGEEIPLIQGKRNPSKTVGVARGHQRADTLKT